MIFDWQKVFSEEILEKAIELEDNVEDVFRNINYISGTVVEDGNEFDVNIDIDDDFHIEYMDCDCGSSKCQHMAALCIASENNNNKYVQYDTLVDKLDQDKLLDFIKHELSCNDDFLKDFKENFRSDYLHSSHVSLDTELFMIFDSPDWVDDLIIFINENLTDNFTNGKYFETVYLITMLFDNLIAKYSLEGDSRLNKSYDTVVNMIMDLSVECEGLIFDFLSECILNNYKIYPEFNVLYDFYCENFNEEKYDARKNEVLNH